MHLLQWNPSDKLSTRLDSDFKHKSKAINKL